MSTLIKEVEAHAAEHREALEAQQQSTDKACDNVRQESAAALQALQAALEARAEERQQRCRAQARRRDAEVDPHSRSRQDHALTPVLSI